MTTRRHVSLLHSAGVVGLVGLAVAACTSAPSPQTSDTSTAAETSSAPTSTTSTPSTPPTSATGSTPPSPSSSSTTPSTTTTPPPATTTATASCATRVAASLTTPQKVGQLLMVGLQSSQSRSALDRTIYLQHIGGVVFLGGWSGSGTVAEASEHLQDATGPLGTGNVRLLIAADQEGGQVQQLKGSGFTTLPSALSMGAGSTTTITANGQLVGAQLKAAGVNVDLAPVADTVPASLGRGNGPIGRYDREFGHDPATVARGVSAFVAGLRAGGAVATVKHFPGLGRVTSNTDTSSTGITDDTTTAGDSYLQPFAAGIAAGAQLVMVSSARYPRIDATNQAVFSSAVITGILRGTMGYGGVVVTDDVGVAKAVAAVPVGDRATRFVDAGGDIVLTASIASVPTMAAALLARYDADPSFAAKVQASLTRVLALKQQLGLLPCG